MSATVILCERNGVYPGIVSENIHNINWKAVDDSSTLYSNYNASIGLGTNSYTKYNFIKFTGAFTNLGNVKITHFKGKFPDNVILAANNSVELDSQKSSYHTPTRNKTAATPNDLTDTNSYINLLVGPHLTGNDPAFSDTKTKIGDSANGALYTNYFITQLQVRLNAPTGDTEQITFLLSYDEL
jgi:hypothetical protein